MSSGEHQDFVFGTKDVLAVRSPFSDLGSGNLIWSLAKYQFFQALGQPVGPCGEFIRCFW